MSTSDTTTIAKPTITGPTASGHHALPSPMRNAANAPAPSKIAPTIGNASQKPADAFAALTSSRWLRMYRMRQIDRGNAHQRSEGTQPDERDRDQHRDDRARAPGVMGHAFLQPESGSGAHDVADR